MVAGFSVFLVSFFNPVLAQEDSAHKEVKNSFNAKEIIFGHVLNNHDFHIIDIVHNDGSKHPVSIPLPVILYSKQRGWTAFMSSRCHHGEENYRNYMMLTDEKIQELKLSPTKYNAQDIVSVNDRGEIDPSVTLYDISITRNVVQMLIGSWPVYLGDVGNCKNTNSVRESRRHQRVPKACSNLLLHLCGMKWQNQISVRVLINIFPSF